MRDGLADQVGRGLPSVDDVRFLRERVVNGCAVQARRFAQVGAATIPVQIESREVPRPSNTFLLLLGQFLACTVSRTRC
jgi:hypothetical protein